MSRVAPSADERTKIFIGDQADRSFWAEVRQTAPLIDIVIDDGGHLPEQQLVTLEELLPHVRPGGVDSFVKIFMTISTILRPMFRDFPII